MVLCANQDLNSVVSTRKVSLNKLNGPPEMQQVVGDMAGTRFTLHLSYANRQISLPTEVGTREREIADCAPARKRDKSRPLYLKLSSVVELAQMYRRGSTVRGKRWVTRRSVLVYWRYRLKQKIKIQWWIKDQRFQLRFGPAVTRKLIVRPASNHPAALPAKTWLVYWWRH